MASGGGGASVIADGLGARLQPGGEKPVLTAWGTGAEQGRGADRLQRPLVPRARVRQQLTASVRRWLVRSDSCTCASGAGALRGMEARRDR
jgi:hypothetical protein